MSGLAIVGTTTRDLVDSGLARIGGAPYYAARALQAAGKTAMIITRCTEEKLIAPIRDFGLPVAWLPTGSAATFALRYDRGEREVSIVSLSEAWSVDDARKLQHGALDGIGWVHLGALWRGEFPAGVAAELRRGRRLSLDGQCLVRPGRLGVVAHEGRLDPALLAHVDVLHLAADEARALGLSLDSASLARLGVSEVIVTLGENGCALYMDGELSRVDATPVPDADPTGAGDGFMAVYLATRCRGLAPLPAAEIATRAIHDLLAGGRP
jgi:sugar/nucleoside kinase (ribokinase family)